MHRTMLIYSNHYFLKTFARTYINTLSYEKKQRSSQQPFPFQKEDKTIINPSFPKSSQKKKMICSSKLVSLPGFKLKQK